MRRLAIILGGLPKLQCKVSKLMELASLVWPPNFFSSEVSRDMKVMLLAKRKRARQRWHAPGAHSSKCMLGCLSTVHCLLVFRMIIPSSKNRNTS